MPFKGVRERSIALQGTRVFFLFLTVRKQAPREAVSYQKRSGLDIPSSRNQEAAEGCGLAILYLRGAGDGSFPPPIGYALLQTQAGRHKPEVPQLAHSQC